MDKLKNFIDTNREAFEDDLLPEGHFERFEQKLAAPRKSRAMLYSLCAFAAAACIALLFLFKLPGGTPLPIQPRQVVTGQHACEVKEEIEELRLYYNMQMSDIISQMQAMYKLQRTPGTALRSSALPLINQPQSDRHSMPSVRVPALYILPLFRESHKIRGSGHLSARWKKDMLSLSS
mgnify:CR=1 FL=1